MALHTTDELRNALRRREIAPVYALFGTETFLRDRAVKAIADRSFDEGELRDFNETEFSLDVDRNLASALAAAEQLPMMSRRRVVRVSDVRVSPTAARENLCEDDESALKSYLDNPAESAVLIFIADEFDKRRRIARLLIEKAVAVEFGTPSDAELAKWARDTVKKAGSEIDERALRLLLSLTGSDVRRLTVEIEKLSTAALPDRVIAADLIATLVANAREISNFDLTDHLFAGRKAEALRTLKKILDDGSEPLALLGLISYNLRRLLMAKEAMEQGADRGEVARIAKLRYSDQQAFMATALRADPKKLSRAIQLLAKTDVAIKTSIGGSGPAGARMQIEMLVSELAGL